MAAPSMLPAAMQEVSEALQPEDELLTADELDTLSLFSTLKKKDGQKGGPDFRKFPNTTVLRKCRRGRVICTQGDAGATAFYILTTEDVLRLRELQLQSLDETIRGKAEGALEFELHPYYVRLTPRELQEQRQQLVEEILELTEQLKQLPPVETADGPQRVAAAAHLLINVDGQRRRRGLLHRLKRMFGNGQRAAQPVIIPVDGPADIRSDTLRAPLHEGELLGEMSCMNRAPRSATVVAERDCYLLEMLRNVLDMLHKDPEYKKKMDATYRKRVMETHVRRLSIFEALTDDQFLELKNRIELVEFDSGHTICEEGEPSDCLYVIRSGLVKVVKNAWYAFRESEFKESHWKALCEEIADDEHDSADLREAILSRLPADLQAALKAKKLTAEQRQSLRESLNDLIRKSDIYLKLGKTSEEILEAVDDPQVRATVAEYSADPKNWSQLEARTFHRVFLETVFPEGLPRQLETAGPRRTLAYLGRGDVFGEIGVFQNQPRSATCVAYDHPDGGYNMKIPDSRMGAVPSRVELIRIHRDDLLKLQAESSEFRLRIEELVSRRQASLREAGLAMAESASLEVLHDREFERLGLVQGQKLMLIDLEKCTRCNACVDACVAAHEDGRNRLYLDGPRYEKYLVPITCRKCLDPVCMIGCPVGAINRGNNGEIIIRDWCIGCEVCANHCPYGSIQMYELREPIQLSPEQKAVLGPDATLKAVSEQAVVCDLCSSLPKQDPSCVYACPHDAAIRVDAQSFFLQGTRNGA